ncbi:PREDICTED: uncharacterized protein LOC107348498 isoform X3 [Acropora digitifera]|uniref:uncharacterized protein LOC107348498 isoform X3 n=1 Tax=Acropora digitifera TaxID=70779 RepID=UPI00077A60AC|nr:PREDICTED: uncharacterized protein LOC107348498 isoform X3 [Acropora digitifera]
MRRRVAEAGGANGYGVYGFIRDLIMEGKDAKFVRKRGKRGHYVLNWPRAVDRYAHYQAKKTPRFKRTNQTWRTASNNLRSALLNSYKKEGAQEFMECKKVNEKDQVVERQFQMPPRVFEALFSDAKLSDNNEEQDEQEGKRHLSEGVVRAQASHDSSSDTGFDETMDLSFDFSESPDSTSLGNVLTNPSLDDSADVKTEGPGNHFSDSAFQTTQIFDEDSVESAVEEFFSESDEIFGFMRVVRDIFPASGPVKGGYYCEISLSEPLPDNVSSGKADFEGVGTVALTKSDPFTLFGLVPASDRPRDVQVKVLSQSGECLGWTWFRYVNKMREVNEMREMVKQLIHNPEKLSLFMTIWSQECHGFEMQLQGDVNATTQAKQKQLVKILELLVYTAAQTGAKQFIEMIFSTSAQQIVFDSYKERATLPEDVARANGHFILAQYLQDINTRLTKEVNDEPKSIDWLELLKAVQNQVSASQDKESKGETTPAESDDNSSDYFANAETSSRASFEHDEEFTSNPEGKDAAEKGGTSSERTKCRSVSRIQEAKRLLMTENAVISASTCRLKRPACSRLPKVHERHLNQELGIFEKSIDDESVHSPSTLLPSSSVLSSPSMQLSKSAILHGLFSGNVSWKNESNMKESKWKFLSQCVTSRIYLVYDVSPVGYMEMLSGAIKCRGVYESKEEKRALMTENVVVSASTCRLKRPGYLVLNPFETDERQLTQEQVIFEKSIGDESGHSPSTLLPSCAVLNKSLPQTDSSASLHGVSSGNVSGKKESNIKELKMARVRSWLSCNPDSEEFPSAEGF